MLSTSAPSRVRSSSGTLVSVALLLSLSGCYPQGTLPPTSAHLAAPMPTEGVPGLAVTTSPGAGNPLPAPAAMALGPGDVFEVRVFQDETLSGTFMVGHDGTNNFPLVGTLAVAGLTPNQLAESLRVRLMQGFIRDPVVSVFLKQTNSKKVFVFGQVRKPGTFNYEDNMNIVQAITLAGGFTDIAARDRTNVTRREGGGEKKYTVPISRILDGALPNFPLLPGDIVFVPESIF